MWPATILNDAQREYLSMIQSILADCIITDGDDYEMHNVRIHRIQIILNNNVYYENDREMLNALKVIYLKK